MPLADHTEIISLSFCGLVLVTWSSLVMDVQFRGVPPGSRSSPTVFSPLSPNRKRQREADEEERGNSQYEASNYCPDQSRSNQA
jgi:hypothetical protein